MSEESTMTNQIGSIDELEPKMRLQGVVESTDIHGAIVDVGLPQKALLHISQLSADNNIDRVADVINPGDKVTVWVSEVVPEEHHISLTMIEPPDVMWKELEQDQVCSGTVTRIESYGAFIDIGAERPGLLHVREMSTGYVEHPSEMVSVGEEVDVRVLKVDRRRRRIDLTMKGLEEEVPVEPEVEEPEVEEEASLTSMEIALQRAYADQEGRGKPSAEKAQADFSEQEDIARRTLEQHADSE